MEQTNEGRGVRIPLALRLGSGVLLLGLSGCGSASSDPVTTGASVPAVTDQSHSVSRAADAAPVGNAVRVEPAGSSPASSTQAGSGLPDLTGGESAQSVAGEASLPFGTATESDRPGDRFSSAPPSSADQQAQRAVREQWYAAMREAPEAGTRLSALEVWARQPGDVLDPVTYGLVDEDDAVRARAQELYERHLQREMHQDETR
ncbi:MAG: hypothetical protein LDL14_03630 [Nitrospira sp.]|nr:hypothetical protein [Nitrospira sp.]